MFRTLLVAVVLLGVPMLVLGQEKPPETTKKDTPPTTGASAGSAVGTASGPLVTVSEQSWGEFVRTIMIIGLLSLIAILLVGLRGDVQRLTDLTAKLTPPGSSPPPV